MIFVVVVVVVVGAAVVVVRVVTVVVGRCPRTAITTSAKPEGPKRRNPAMRSEHGRAHC